MLSVYGVPINVMESRWFYGPAAWAVLPGPCYAALYDRCHSALSLPTTKTSRCPAAHELTAGEVLGAICPPSEVQPDQALLL